YAAAGGSQHRDGTADQFGSERRQAVIVAVRPAVFDRHVPALDIAAFRQAAAKGRHGASRLRRRTAAHESDDRTWRLLPADAERPRRRAAEQRDELAPPHFFAPA